jgi:hypothetical protein
VLRPAACTPTGGASHVGDGLAPVGGGAELRQVKNRCQATAILKDASTPGVFNLLGSAALIHVVEHAHRCRELVGRLDERHGLLQRCQVEDIGNRRADVHVGGAHCCDGDGIEPGWHIDHAQGGAEVGGPRTMAGSFSGRASITVGLLVPRGLGPEHCTTLPVEVDRQHLLTPGLTPCVQHRPWGTNTYIPTSIPVHRPGFGCRCQSGSGSKRRPSQSRV